MRTAIGKLRKGLSDGDKGRLASALASGPAAVPNTIGAPLPAVTAPRTDDLVVVVPEAEDPGVEDILARFERLRREHAGELARVVGEPVQLGDAVCIDVIGYRDGEAVPMTARREQWLTIEHDDVLPGFALGLVGTAVGGTTTVDVTLPVDYPVAALRARRVVFAVSVRAAHEVQLPAADDPAFLAATGKGETMEAVMETIAQELVDELADELVERGRTLVLDELARRLDVELPAGLVNDEIRRTWQQTEGDLLIEIGASFAEQQRSSAAWREDPATREDAERRLRRALALGAVAKRDGLRVTKQDVDDFLREISKATGTPMFDLVAEVQKERSLQKQLSEKLLSALAEEHVIEQATIRFAGAE